MDLKVFVAVVMFCSGFNSALAQSCGDTNVNCRLWPQNYCTVYREYMKKECARKCGYCSGPTLPPACADKEISANCMGWKGYGFCESSSQYHNYMKEKCLKTCGFCGSCSLSQKLQSCSFTSDTCDFVDVPFDDDLNFALRNSGGQDSKGGYLSASGTGEAHLILPLELVVPHNKDFGNMCMEFYYRISSGGFLKVYEVQNSKNYPKTTKLNLTGRQSSWRKVSLTFQAAQFNHLLIQTSPNSGSVDIDNVRFCDGSCS